MHGLVIALASALMTAPAMITVPGPISTDDATVACGWIAEHQSGSAASPKCPASRCLIPLSSMAMIIPSGW